MTARGERSKSTRRITPRGASAEAGRQKKQDEAAPAKEPAEAEIVPPRGDDADLLRDMMFDLMAPLGPTTRFELELDVVETQDALILRAEVPGLSADDVRVTVQGDLLMIEGEQRARAPGDEDVPHVRERGEGRFFRSFRLPRAVEAEAIEADAEDGILTIVIAKPETDATRRIQVRAGKGSAE